MMMRAFLRECRGALTLQEGAIMRNYLGAVVITACMWGLCGGVSQAACVVDTTTPTYANGALIRNEPCTSVGAQKTAEQYDGGGEHSLEGVTYTEEHYLTIPIGGTDAMITADQLIKTGPGYVRSITCYSDATATAGTIALRDNTASGAGNILWSFDVLAVAYNTPFTVDLQTPFSIGLYLDFTTTADVKCMVRFR